jgi:hypothetical protein
MIKTLSPHYKNIPWIPEGSGEVAEKYVLNLYVWSGLKANAPATPVYEIENVNPLGITSVSLVNISNYVNEFINNNLITSNTSSLNNSNGMVWVKTEVIYYILDTAQPPEFIEIDSAVKGYGYGNEGLNPSTPVSNYLATSVEQKVYNNGVYIFNFLASETVSTVIKLQSENTIKTLTKTATTNSLELVQSCYVKISEFSADEYIEIYKDDVLINTLLITDEPRYTPIDAVFLNKEGQHQSVTLFKEKTDKLKVERESYESSNGQPIDGFHQFKNYNVNGQDSFSMNSGFVKEDNNEVFTQLLLSEKVWQLLDNVYIPLNLSTDDIEYKTRQKDRLLNYKIDFKYSFNKINNI